MQKIIFVEGLPGTGKSTISNWITTELCNQGKKAVLLEEENLTIPTNFYHIASLEKAIFHNLCQSNQDKAAALKNIAMYEKNYIFIPIDDAPDELQAELYNYELGDEYNKSFNPESYIEQSLLRVIGSLKNLNTKTNVAVIDSGLLQNPINELLYRGATDNQIKNYVKAITKLFEPYNPICIYLNRGGAKESLDFARRVKGDGWYNRIEEMLETTGSQNHFERRYQLEIELLAQNIMPWVDCNVTGNDWTSVKEIIQEKVISNPINQPMLEEMSTFFNKRVDSYDEHMLVEVGGCKEGYLKMAELIPKTSKNMLDLGCGTGLELDEIFKSFPNLKVTGIDLAKGMLDKLKEKHPNKDLTLINVNYFDYDLGNEIFDVAVSFETLHHFSHEEKIKLYNKLFKSLVKGGIYIEGDYMAPTQEYEDYYFAENKRIRSEMGITEGFYHYDTPCTVANQIEMLKLAGFKTAKEVWQKGTVIIVAEK